MTFLCWLFGHNWNIQGATGKYSWCSRCARRRDNESGEELSWKERQ